MARYVEKCRCRSQEVTAEILRAAHHEPSIVQKRIKLLACPKSFVFGSGRTAFRLLRDRVQLYGFLHLLYRALEITLWLRHLRVSQSLGRMHQHTPGVVILIFAFHLFKLLLVMFRAIIIDIVTRSECLPVARSGSILLCRTP